MFCSVWGLGDGEHCLRTCVVAVGIHSSASGRQCNLFHCFLLFWLESKSKKKTEFQAKLAQRVHQCAIQRQERKLMYILFSDPLMDSTGTLWSITWRSTTRVEVGSVCIDFEGELEFNSLVVLNQIVRPLSKYQGFFCLHHPCSTTSSCSTKFGHHQSSGPPPVYACHGALETLWPPDQ